MKPLLRHVRSLILIGLLCSWGLCVASDLNSSLAPLSAKLVGVKDFRPEFPHSDHFHISFAPPKIQSIAAAPKLLLVQATEAGAVSFTQPMATGGLEGGYRDVQMLQVVQNAAATAKKTLVLDSCLRAERGVGGLIPLTDLKFYSRQMKQPVPEYITDATVTITKQPNFGTVVPMISKYGEMQFDYVAFDKSWLGHDRVEFEVIYQGKTYKIINRIEMVTYADLSDEPHKKYYDGPCDSRVRRIAYEGALQTANSVGFDWDGVSAMLDSAASSLDLSNIMLVFGGLADGSVGQTTGDGSKAAITLDTTAAGHGWYIDPTPLDNTDDYLPTSNPNVWRAKTGTDAAGKMDMLSVLLHEYGHALGLEHGSDELRV